MIEFYILIKYNSDMSEYWRDYGSTPIRRRELKFLINSYNLKVVK